MKSHGSHLWEEQKEEMSRNPLTEEQTRDGDSVYIHNAEQLEENGDKEFKCSINVELNMYVLQYIFNSLMVDKPYI